MKFSKIIIFLLTLYSLYFVFCSIGSPIMANMEHFELADKFNALLFQACHHKPEKCFWILKYPMPLCCRCFGFYLSFLIYGLTICFKTIKISNPLFILIILGFITDFIINYVFKITTWNISRFISGICLAILLIHLIIVITERRKEKV